MNAAQAYAAAVDALQAARRRNREIRRACECYEAPEEATHDYPGSDGYPPCPWSKRPREDWCDACAALTDIPRIGPLKDAQRAALRAVLAEGRSLAKVPRASSSLEALAVRLAACDRERAAVTKERNAIECDQAARDQGEGLEPVGPCPWGGEPPEWAEEDFTAPRNVRDGHGGWIQPCWTRKVETITDTCPGGMYHRQEYAELRVPVEECCPSCQRRVGLTHDLHTLNRRRAALISLIARHPDTGAPPRPPRQPKPRRPVWTPDIDPAPAYPQPKPPEEGDDVPF